MKARSFIESGLVIAVMTVALWAAGAGTASAQVPPPGPCVIFGEVEVPIPCPPLPPTCVEFTEEEEPRCTSQIAVFTPDADSWTYIFDANNSIKITTRVNDAFALKVDLVPMTQLEFAGRTAPQFLGAQCWPTLGVGCVFYKVHGEFVPRVFYGEFVEYIVGFTTPPIQGNKHDWMLLRAPGEQFLGDPIIPLLFSEEITTKVLRNYDAGVDDPGVGGVALGFSDYTVAFLRRRPVGKP